jgi:hypothetical protein
VLAGSIDLGAEEQFRLDPFVRAVMSVGVNALIDPIGRFLAGGPFSHVRLFDRLGRGVATGADRAWDELMTRYFMVVDTPGQRLRLGRDVPPYPGQRLIGRPFEHPSEPELMEVFNAFDRTHGTGRGDASRDWADLGDRMDWICWFFLSRDRDPQLARSPFSRAVVRQLGEALGAAM